MAQPAGWPGSGDPPQAPRRRNTGLKITLGVLAALLLGGGAGGYAVARPVLAEHPATLTTPDSLAGMSKLSDPTFDGLADRLRTQLDTAIDATSTLVAFYAPGGDKTKIVMLAGATRLMVNPGTQLVGAFQGMGSGGLSAGGIAPVDAGPMGGSAKCGGSEASGVRVAICAWADHGSVGIVMAFNRTPGDTADLLRRIRPEVLHRG